MKAVATIQICEQVSQDDWQLISYHKQLNEYTTMIDIEIWVRSKLPSHERNKEEFKLPTITIRPLE